MVRPIDVEPGPCRCLRSMGMGGFPSGPGRVFGLSSGLRSSMFIEDALISVRDIFLPVSASTHDRVWTRPSI